MEEAEKDNTPYTNQYSVEKRGNGTEVFTETYSEKRVNRLKKLLVTFSQHGEAKYYSIHVDGETVVEQTADVNLFDKYIPFVDAETRTIEVRIYKGKSFNGNKYVFVRNSELAGLTKQAVNMEEEIKKALKQQAQKNELDYLRSELLKREKKLKKLKKIVKAKAEGISMGEVKNFLVEGKGLLDAFRGNGSGGQLYGTPEPESEVTIEADEEVTEEQEIFSQLYSHVGAKGIRKALNIMGILSQHPELEELLINELKKKEEDKDGEA